MLLKLPQAFALSDSDSMQEGPVKFVNYSSLHCVTEVHLGNCEIL